MIAKSKHIDYIDLAKGFCIIFVAFHHVLCNYHMQGFSTKHIVVFLLPLFFCLSGVFFKTYGGFAEFMRKKINSLIIPFVSFYILTVILLPLLLSWLGLPVFDVPSLLRCMTNLYHEHWETNRAIWFLLCLFEMNMMFYIIYVMARKMTEHKRRNVMIISVLSMFIGCCGYAMFSMGVNLPFFIDSAMTLLPFFSFGYFLKNNTGFLYANRQNHWIGFLCVIVCFAICYILSDKEVFIKNKYETNIFELYGCGVAGTLGVLLLSKQLGSLPVITYFGRYSLIILVTHRPVLNFITKVCDYYSISPQYAIVLVFLGTMISMFVIIPVLRKYCGYIVAQKELIPNLSHKEEKSSK